MGTKILNLEIEWSGPHTLEDVIANMTDGGKKPDYDGKDYGLYQIYGRHILAGENTLLYVGKAIRQKFSTRFKQHEKWLKREENVVNIYLGRAYKQKRHTSKNKWKTWEQDLKVAEKMIIYKYSPNYNSSNICNQPKIDSFRNIILYNKGDKNRLEKVDNFLKDL